MRRGSPGGDDGGDGWGSFPPPPQPAPVPPPVERPVEPPPVEPPVVEPPPVEPETPKEKSPLPDESSVSTARLRLEPTFAGESPRQLIDRATAREDYDVETFAILCLAKDAAAGDGDLRTAIERSDGTWRAEAVLPSGETFPVAGLAGAGIRDRDLLPAQNRLRRR